MLAYIPAPWIRHGMGKPMGKTHPPGHRRSWSWPGSRLRPCQRPLNNTPPRRPGRPSGLNEPKRAFWMDQVHQNWKNTGKKHGKKRVHLRKMLKFTRKHGKTLQCVHRKSGWFHMRQGTKSLGNSWKFNGLPDSMIFYGDTHWYQWGYKQQIWQSTDWFTGIDHAGFFFVKSPSNSGIPDTGLPIKQWKVPRKTYKQIWEKNTS